MRAALGQYAVAAVVFGILDGLWLGVIGRPIYDDQLGDLLAAEPNALAAVAFYAIYIVGITYFVTRPALAAGSGRKALVAGALLGFVAYATWDLTNLAVIEGFPASIVAVDLAWGTFATAVASLVTYAVCRRVPALG
ncbi:DUF2177 family protein [Knoellia locipacati]|uniref:DUF2177 family protein n=1 Tax=Knoellia locipacati TaxID=882824 RepID=UPI00384C83E3